jgi:hypothetical protein
MFSGEGSGKMDSIMELENRVRRLREEGRGESFDRIFEIFSNDGKLEIPESFRKKAIGYFARRGEEGVLSQDAIMQELRTQRIVRTYNKWTGESTLFNPLRASRPRVRVKEAEEEKRRIYHYIQKTEERCDFCFPELYTPIDSVGRIKGKHCITASNLAKYDAYNTLICFNNHNPLEFNKEEISDYIEVGFKWFEKVYKYNQEFRYPLFIWNCLEEAGASQVHGHIQLLMGRRMHYGGVLSLMRVFQQYELEFGRNYFDDLFEAHRVVGLSILDKNTKIFVYLTPIKEKETLIVSDTLSAPTKNAIFNVLRCYVDRFGMTSFNLAILMPPLGEDKFAKFPYIIRMVERGSIYGVGNIGGMELYGSSVVSIDPYILIDALHKFYETFP